MTKPNLHPHLMKIRENYVEQIITQSRRNFAEQDFKIGKFPEFKIVAGKTSFATYEKNTIKISINSFNYGPVYLIYLIHHELTHLIAHLNFTLSGPHDDNFKYLERMGLQYWNITLEYGRAYPVKLWHNGMLVFIDECGHWIYRKTVNSFMEN